MRNKLKNKLKTIGVITYAPLLSTTFKSAPTLSQPTLNTDGNTFYVGGNVENSASNEINVQKFF